MLEEKLNELLEQQHIICIQDVLTMELVVKLRAQILCMAVTSNESPKLFIDCGGGECEAALIFADFLCSFRIPVVGIINGSCKSSAMLVLQGCAKRLATPHSQFFLHHLLHGFNYTLEDAYYKQSKNVNEAHGRETRNQIYEFLAKRTGNTKKEIREIAKRGECYEWMFYADTAKKLRFIDDIIQPGGYPLLSTPSHT
ncbi:MAG: hypothetical protein G01um101429_672 [Parcubacteria group bacterium Gr01-1014_29]|nr:MAG: hypothetical protein G01um101429_672 [Parcubacteria group bacterium Gr01-1014_29]